MISLPRISFFDKDYTKKIEDFNKQNCPFEAVMDLEVMDEDWRTAIALKKRSLEKGEKITVKELFMNMEGLFFECSTKDGLSYSVDPNNLSRV